MAKLLKLRRGTTTQHASFTGAEGEVTIDTTKDTAVVHDGSQVGGRPLARQDMNNVPAGTILGTQLENSGVTGGQYGSSSAIPIITVDNQGLVTAASTTAIDSTTIANGSSSVSVANNGAITSNANHDFTAGIDVTGNITTTGNMSITNINPNIALIDSNNTSDFQVQNDNGNFNVRDTTNSANRLRIDATGGVNIPGNTDFGAGIDVTGNISVTGTVDGVDIAAKTLLFDHLTSTNGLLSNGVTATTQAQSDNSTKVSTTAYVRTAISEAQAFPSGTKMLFQQTAAPTGWTKVTSGVDNKALRVVSGTVGSGGTNAFTNTLASRGITANAGNTTQGGNVSVSVANATQGGNISVGNTSAGGSVNISSVSTSGNVNSHTLSVNEMPSHSHNYTANNVTNHGFYGGSGGVRISGSTGSGTGNTGGGGGHSHGFSGSSHNHNASFSGSNHNHNASFSGSAHNHNANASFSGSAHNHSISV